MTRSTLAYVVVVGLLIAAIALGVRLRHAEHALDCGPDGISALNGTACIDRDPVTIP